MGRVVVGKSLRIAGDEMDEAIINYARLKYSLLLGQARAEIIKISIGSASLVKEKFTVVRGRDLETGLPKSIKLSSDEIREALLPTINQITMNIKEVLEEAPPELVSDVMKRGITVTGGGSLIVGLDKAIEEATKMPVV